MFFEQDENALSEPYKTTGLISLSDALSNVAAPDPLKTLLVAKFIQFIPVASSTKPLDIQLMKLKPACR